MGCSYHNFCSGFQIASAKAAQHRLERGVWTSVRFGDMRRALSSMYYMQLFTFLEDGLVDSFSFYL